MWRRKRYSGHTDYVAQARHGLHRTRHNALQGGAQMEKHIVDEANTLQHAAHRSDGNLVPFRGMRHNRIVPMQLMAFFLDWCIYNDSTGSTGDVIRRLKQARI